MPEIAVLFYLGLAIIVIAIVLLIYAAVRRPQGPTADDPWWMKFLEWIYEKLGAVGVVGVLLLVLGLALTTYGWSPSVFMTLIEWFQKLGGNTDNSVTPSPS